MEGGGFNSLCMELLLPFAGFAFTQMHAVPTNAAKVVAMLDTGLVLGLVLHLPRHWVAFRQQSSRAFVYLDSCAQQPYPQTDMRAAMHPPPVLATSSCSTCCASHQIAVRASNVIFGFNLETRLLCWQPALRLPGQHAFR